MPDYGEKGSFTKAFYESGSSYLSYQLLKRWWSNRVETWITPYRTVETNVSHNISLQNLPEILKFKKKKEKKEKYFFKINKSDIFHFTSYMLKNKHVLLKIITLHNTLYFVFKAISYYLIEYSRIINVF